MSASMIVPFSITFEVIRVSIILFNQGKLR
jgi:hypothetical protein